jgi:hypothetical protein
LSRSVDRGGRTGAEASDEGWTLRYTPKYSRIQY